MEPVIIDAVVVAVLAAFTVFGARRGLFRAVAGLLIVVIALVGAGLVAGTLAQPVSEVLAPVIEGRIEQKVQNALESQVPEAQETPQDAAELPARIESLLEAMGMDPETVETLAGQAVEKVQKTGATLAAAVVESMTYSLLYGVLFLISFAALLLVLKIAARALDLVLKLPLLHGLNTVGGAGVGLVEGGLLLFLAIWAGRRLGMSFETELLASTTVFRFFTTNTPLSVLSFLL